MSYPRLMACKLPVPKDAMCIDCFLEACSKASLFRPMASHYCWRRITAGKKIESRRRSVHVVVERLPSMFLLAHDELHELHGLFSAYLISCRDCSSRFHLGRRRGRFRGPFGPTISEPWIFDSGLYSHTFGPPPGNRSYQCFVSPHVGT